MDRGYYHTANVSIPFNKRAPGEIADIAWQQLQAYRAAAQTWPVFKDDFSDEESRVRTAHRCRVCCQNVWFTCDIYGHPYDNNQDDMLSLLVAHLRQNHSEVIDAGQEAIAAVLDVSSGNDTNSRHRGNPGRFGDQDSDPRGSN